VSAPLHLFRYRAQNPSPALRLLTYLSVHDVLFNSPGPDTDPTEDFAQPKTSLNGNHTGEDTSAPAPALEPAIAPTTQVSSGIDGIAQFMPDQQDTNSLFGDSEMGAISVGHAVEAPTSDLREEPATAEELFTAHEASVESTQEVAETQLAPVEEPSQEPSFDAMDTTVDAPVDTKPAESSAPPTKPMHDLTIQTNSDAASTQAASLQSPAVVDREMEDAPSSGKTRRREDDEDDVPEAKRTKTEDDSTSQVDFKVPEMPAQSEQPNGNGVPSAPGSSSAQEPSGVHNAVDFEAWPLTPMTNAQTRFLLERIRNTKKIKVSLAFKDPVDHVALGIPTYPDYVKKPMDLSTMEHKLKENRYNNIREFMADLDQMIENSELFNNKQHPVTQAGYNLRAYFLKGMGKMPRGGVEDPPKQAKAKKPTVNTGGGSKAARRPSQVVAPPPVRSPAVPTPTTATSSAAWPLQNGVPVIRRDSSSLDRPKREIHRPSKDLPYSNAKPRKKKFQQELKFCESVLTELMKPKYANLTFAFVSPVDPVALNIPSYLTIIKKPMDFGTIEKNLKNGAYQSAKDFYKDAQLVFGNCYKFNPEGDAVNKMGHDLEDLFEELWREKDAWLAQHAPAPEQSPELYSEDEDEDEEEEEADPAEAQFLAIQKQIAQLNETAQALLQQQKGAKRAASPKAASKKKKSAAPKRPAQPLHVPPPAQKGGRPKPRVKQPQPLSFLQKQEISEGISTLGDADMRKAVQIIRNGCPHLANVNDDEMELDMDEINDECLRELFKFIKSIRGPKGGFVADDDFEPPRQLSKQTTSRPKKNKPMGKTEQEDNMRKIQEKLQSFQGGASGSSQSPTGKLLVNARDDSELTCAAHDDASSDDDESSGSESEEE
jgi:bromodomain-containing factor 1